MGLAQLYSGLIFQVHGKTTESGCFPKILREIKREKHKDRFRKHETDEGEDHGVGL
jgi:hypothetical protein